MKWLEPNPHWPTEHALRAYVATYGPMAVNDRLDLPAVTVEHQVAAGRVSITADKPPVVNRIETSAGLLLLMATRPPLAGERLMPPRPKQPSPRAPFLAAEVRMAEALTHINPGLASGTKRFIASLAALARQGEMGPGLTQKQAEALRACVVRYRRQLPDDVVALAREPWVPVTERAVTVPPPFDFDAQPVLFDD